MEAAATAETAAELNDSAVKLQAEGKHREAEELYKKSLTIWEATVGPEDPLVAQSLSNRASLYRSMGEYHEGERLFQIALRIWKKRGFPRRGEVSARSDMEVTLKRLGPWYHNVVFAPGVMSNPGNPDYPASRWRVLDQVIPKDLSGKSVLDIGCNSGFFSREMKKRGAERVVGVDIMPYLLAQSRFGSHWFNLPLEWYECRAYDARSLESSFDVIVFIGVLYHLKHPLYALEQIASICKDTMYFQSMVRGPAGDIDPAEDYSGNEVAIFDDPAWPKLYFIEKKFNGDESNWWFATWSCLKAMLRTAGFCSVEEISNSEIFVCRK
jgi:tRNA (mo5U34)-methyltransferase